MKKIGFSIGLASVTIAMMPMMQIVSSQTTESNDCDLDDGYINVIISTTYSGISLLALFIVSLLSFKTVINKETQNSKVQEKRRMFSCCSFVTRFYKDVWHKKKCFLPILANFFDQASDIAVIFTLYTLSVDEEKGKINCDGINTFGLFVASLTSFFTYRFVSGLVVLIGTRRVLYSLGQFFFEAMVYRAVWVNYEMQVDEPCSAQKWLQNMEAMLEAFPQLIIQLFFLVENAINSDSSTIFGLNIVTFSICFSFVSMVNKAVSEDKALFVDKDYQKASWFGKKNKIFIVNLLYLWRLMFRVFDVSSRGVIVILCWTQLGGFLVMVIGAIEFGCMIILTIATGDPSPMTWIAIIPLNNVRNFACLPTSTRFIVIVARFLEHATILVLCTLLSSFDGVVLGLYIYAWAAFFLCFASLACFVLSGTVSNKEVSTNRTLLQLVKLGLLEEIAQMEKFGFFFGKMEWKITIHDSDALEQFFREDNKLLIDKVVELTRKEAIRKNQEDPHDTTVLMYACRFAKADTLKALLAIDGMDEYVNISDKDGWTALMYASFNGHDDIVEILLTQKEVDVNAADANGWTALMWATRYGYSDVVQLLLSQKEIDVNQVDKVGWSALMWATRYGYVEILEMLLARKGIEVGLTDHEGWNALQLASDYNRTYIASLLRSAGTVQKVNKVG